MKCSFYFFSIFFLFLNYTSQTLPNVHSNIESEPIVQVVPTADDNDKKVAETETELKSVEATKTDENLSKPKQSLLFQLIDQLSATADDNDKKVVETETKLEPVATATDENLRAPKQSVLSKQPVQIAPTVDDNDKKVVETETELEPVATTTDENLRAPKQSVSPTQPVQVAPTADDNDKKVAEMETETKSEAVGTTIDEKSETLHITKGDIFKIIKEGTDWIFLGETKPTDTTLIRLLSRNFDNDNTIFSLQALESGKAQLQFYKQDLLRNIAKNDYVQVEISDIKNNTIFVTEHDDDSEHLNIIDEPQVEVVDVSTPVAEQEKELSLLERSQQAFKDKKYEIAADLLKKYFSTTGTIEGDAYFLQGKIYEAEFKAKNLKTAYEGYKKVVEDFPFNENWDEANKRYVYLQRFYFNIR